MNTQTMIYDMLLKEKSAKDCTKIIFRLLNRLKVITDEKDTDLNMLKLQSFGFSLKTIENNGYSIIGIFRKIGFVKEIHIPFYKINEDVLDQLEDLVEEYNLYLEEQQNKLYENKRSRIKTKEFIDLNSEEINWDKIYNTRTYAQILLNTAVELLYSKFNEELEITKYYKKL